jgi:hypothetical protein
MQNIPVFSAIDNCPHAPTTDALFQESSLFVWHDLKAGIGGFWRLGQEPVVSMLNSCFGVFTHDGARFRSNVTGVPMVLGDRSETHMAWGDQLRVDLDTLSIRARFRDCEASLQFTDFNPRYDYMALVGIKMPPGHAGHHFEVAGRMTGRVRLGDREYEIDALGYRDRSWGAREWGVMRSTRWWPVVFGPDLCIHTMSSLLEGGHRVDYAHVIRNGMVMVTSNIDVIVTLESDAFSPRSGKTRLTFENGETIDLIHNPSDGIVLHVRGYTAFESIGAVQWQGRSGMSLLEVSTNASGGSKPPLLAILGNNGDGFSRRDQ